MRFDPKKAVIGMLFLIGAMCLSISAPNDPPKLANAELTATQYDQCYQELYRPLEQRAEDELKAQRAEYDRYIAETKRLNAESEAKIAQMIETWNNSPNVEGDDE